MPAPRFITSDSQMVAPGVYVQENAPAVPTRGQRNRVIGLVGQCVRGPSGRAIDISSTQRFNDVFGGRDRATNGGTILGHVWKALQGGRFGKIYVVRVVAADAVKASFTFETAAGGAGTAVLRVDAFGYGASGNDIKAKVTAASNGDANAFNLVTKLYGKQVIFENMKITTGFDNTNQVIGSDDATWIRVVKLADGRPVNNAASTDGADTDGFLSLGQTVSGYTSVAGSDGTIANTDYTVADGPMEIINGLRGVHACAVVGRSNTTIKAKIALLAADCSQRVWFACPDDENVTYSTAATERATFTNLGRMSYWFNHRYITDPVTLEEIVEEPFILPMSIISQTDPDIHVGDAVVTPFTLRGRRLKFELNDSVRDALTRGFVSFLIRDQDLNDQDVILPGNATTCDSSVNNRELDGRYMKDFILDLISKRLRGDQFKGNTPIARAERAGAVSGALNELAKNGRYIQTDEQTGRPLFTYVNNNSVNAPEDQAFGDQTEQLAARLIPKNIRIKLNASIGVDATVTEQ